MTVVSILSMDQERAGFETCASNSRRCRGVVVRTRAKAQQIPEVGIRRGHSGWLFRPVILRPPLTQLGSRGKQGILRIWRNNLEFSATIREISILTRCQISVTAT
jgi:hypothetical protein